MWSISLESGTSGLKQLKTYLDPSKEQFSMRLEDWKTKIIGFGCDGASANMAEGGLKGLLRS